MLIADGPWLGIKVLVGHTRNRGLRLKPSSLLQVCVGGARLAVQAARRPAALGVFIEEHLPPKGTDIMQNSCSSHIGDRLHSGLCAQSQTLLSSEVLPPVAELGRLSFDFRGSAESAWVAAFLSPALPLALLSCCLVDADEDEVYCM